MVGDRGARRQRGQQRPRLAASLDQAALYDEQTVLDLAVRSLADLVRLGDEPEKPAAQG